MCGNMEFINRKKMSKMYLREYRVHVNELERIQGLITIFIRMFVLSIIIITLILIQSPAWDSWLRHHRIKTNLSVYF